MTRANAQQQEAGDAALLARAKSERAKFDAEVKAVNDGKMPLAEFLRVKADDSPKFTGFAATLLSEDDLEGAAAAAELATIADEKNFDAWLTLGAARARAQQEEKALQAYARAAALKPHDVRVWTDVGELKLILLDYAGAAQALKLALQADPKGDTPAGRRAQYLIAKTFAKVKGK